MWLIFRKSLKGPSKKGFGNHLKKRLKSRLKDRSGTTFPELLTVLLIVSLMFSGMTGMMAVSIRARDAFAAPSPTEAELRHLYIYFQKQVRQSEKMILSDWGLCLEDMESRHLKYWNYYTWDERSGILYRHKLTDAGKPRGSKTQLAASLTHFSMVWHSERRCIDLHLVMNGEKELKMALPFRGEVAGDFV